VGLADPSWDHVVANGSIRTLLAQGKDVLVGGDFDRVDDERYYALALLAVADPPNLFVEPGPRLRILKNLADGPEVTHFLIVSNINATLFRADGLTLVRSGESISVADGAAGLVFHLNSATGQVTIASALTDTPGGAGAAANASLTTNDTTPQVITFSLSRSAYTLKENGGTLTVQVLKHGVGAASVRYATADGTANQGSDYQTLSGQLNFASAETQKSLPALRIVDDFSAEGDEVLLLQLFSPVNGILVEPALATVTILDNDVVSTNGVAESCLINAPPEPKPIADAALVVMLEPAGALGRWRLEGGDWLSSGALVRGLLAANYLVEFQPVPGYLEPGRRVVPVEAGRTNVISATYALVPAGGAGELMVILEPAAVASNPLVSARGQWRRQGEAVWRDSGELLTGLSAGPHVLEFKPVPDRATPPPRLCQIGAGQENVVSATYLHAFETGAPAPHVLTPAETDEEPYAYCGQLRTALGAGSGTVVKSRVVLTAAHVLFDELQFTYVTDVKWVFQRHRGDFEPPVQTPRGWYTFEGYAAQRQLEQSPGISEPDSQQLDAAALFFVETPTEPNLPGRGGYSGFLLSESNPSEWLTSVTRKMLVGYPLESIAEANQGRLHASTPTKLSFELVNGALTLYTSDDLRSFPGNSGGPLFVEAEDGAGIYYPAGIYLGGLEKTVVRVIDAEVVDLINRAEYSSNGSGNNTGGGVVLWAPGLSTPAFHPGLLGVVLGPTNAVQAGGAWRVRRGALDFSDYFAGAQLVYPSVPGPIPVEFRPVPGYLTPPPRLVTVFANETNRIRAYYLPPPVLHDGAFEATYPGRTGRVYQVDMSTNLLNWSTVKLLTNRTGDVRYVDPLTNSPEAPARFFRLTEQP
jgi:hypothetical protein